MDFKRKYSTPPVLLKGFKKKATLPLFEDRSRKEEQRSLPVALPELSALSAAGPEPPPPVELKSCVLLLDQALAGGRNTISTA